MKKLPALLIIIFLAACSRGDKTDVRGVSWGMAPDQVKGLEKAELANESGDIITYRIGGVKKIDVADDNPPSGDSDAPPPEVEEIDYEYDLLYVFNNNKLSMAVVHLRDTLESPEDYLELFRGYSKKVSDKTGQPARGIVSYPEGEEEAPDPYSDPASICRGEHSVKHFWPSVKKRTNITLELDSKKYAPGPECNISVFYESVKYPADPDLSQELHDLL